jgi:multidrug efflux system membrane fusion protein
MTGRLRTAVLALALAGAAAARAADLDARTDWVERTELATPLAVAVVAEVRVRPGDRVSQGEVLVRLDQRGAQAQLQEAQAAFEEARQAREEGQRELERALELYERTVLSQHELQTAEIVAAGADAAYRRAAAALTQARLGLEYTRIEAPFDAVVVDVRVRPAEVVINRLQAAPLVVVARADRMGAVALLAAQQLQGVRPGDQVRLAIGGAWRSAVVTGIATEPGPGAEGRYALTAEFESQDGEPLRAGRAATLRIGERP